MSKDDSKNDSTSITDITQETENNLVFPKENSLMVSVSMTLMQVISENHLKPNFKAKLKAQSKHIFTSKFLPKICLGDYLNRILKYTKIEESTLVIALIYLDRICKKNKILLTEYNVHRLLFSSILASLKYNEDKFYSNIFYAKIGGVEVKKLNKLEAEFLVHINFDLYVEPQLYEKYETTLLKNCQ